MPTLSTAYEAAAPEVLDVLEVLEVLEVLAVLDVLVLLDESLLELLLELLLDEPPGLRASVL